MSRRTEFINVGDRRFKIFDFSEEFVERIRRISKVRRLSGEEILDEHDKFLKEKGMTDG